MKPRHLVLVLMLALLLGLPAGSTYAQSADAGAAVSDTSADTADQASDDTSSATTQPADQAQPMTEAEQAMDALLGSREAAPVIEPTAEPSVQTPGVGMGAAARIDIDPAVLGIAPGQDPPPLRREGEFIVNRRGRLVRSHDGGFLLFVFESDTQDAPELPMVLQACQYLEAMEDTVEKRGDTVVFILSGQIHTYRGANYLLPTMMKIAFDKGNLTN